MAVLVEGLSVIVRREVITRRYRGGWPGFAAEAENKTVCADSELARIGFMHPDDVGAFVRRLERVGFVFCDQLGAAIDMVVVDQREGPTTPCSWIEFFHEKVPGGTVAAVRLVGSEDRTLICPDDWTFESSLSHRFKFHPGRRPGDEIEFVRSEPGVDVFRDRSTGEEQFTGRTRRHVAAEEGETDDVDRIREMHGALYREAIELVEPCLVAHVRTGDPRPAKTTRELTNLARACELLGRVTASCEDNWSAWWALGMARRFLGDHQAAHQAFARAYAIAPSEIEVGRNLACESIALGYASEAVAVTTALVKLFPGDAGLVANYSLALLVSGDVTSALREAERALELDPSDAITMNLRKLVEAVHEGRIAAPSRWPPG